MSKYTVHFELTDGTLCDAHVETSTKACALKIAKSPLAVGVEESGIARVVVCRDELTVASFENLA